MLNMFRSLGQAITLAALLSATARASTQGGAVGGLGATGATTRATSIAASAGSAVTAAGLSVRATTACNNSPELCGRTYNNITHMGAHDSAFLRDASTDRSLSGNQYYNATLALDAGLRFLQAQVHDKFGVIELCHSSCALLDAGPLESWLRQIRLWMDGNANEVVTILLVNSDTKSADELGTVFNSSGIAKYGYSHGSGTKWATLQDMIAAETRLVTFIAPINASTTYPYLLPEWDHVFETDYEITSLSAFNCTLDRPSTYKTAASALSAGLLPLVNHFAYQTLVDDVFIPDVTHIDIVNGNSTSTTGALGLHAQSCASEYGQKPTFMLVDFWNRGPAMDTADEMNGIKGATTGRTTISATANGAGRLGWGIGTGALVALMAAAVVLV